jgi:Na+/phosphate symporter
MFLLGSAITAISMSVSLSVSILVPLNDRGLVRRENVIPYIMGANITTFIDTLLASLFMSSPAAFDVVLAEMLSVALAAVLILILAFRHYEHTLQRFVEWVTARPWHLMLFLFLLFAMPLAGLWI